MAKTAAEAVRQALRLLARREHSGRELRAKLRARGYPEAATAAALQRLRAEGLQSDERYAEARARALIARGCGSLRVAAELSGQGVPAAALAAAVAAARAGELERACAALRARAGRSREQALRFLLGRGYPTGVARSAAARSAAP